MAASAFRWRAVESISRRPTITRTIFRGCGLDGHRDERVGPRLRQDEQHADSVGLEVAVCQVLTMARASLAKRPDCGKPRCEIVTDRPGEFRQRHGFVHRRDHAARCVSPGRRVGR